MKEILFINDTPANKISYYLFLLFLVGLPFDLFYSELVLVCLLVHTIIHFRKKNISTKLFLSAFPFLIYLLTIAGTLYSSNKEQAFEEWGKQLSFLIFPFIIYATTLDLEKHKLSLLKGFAFTCTIVVLYLFADAFRIIRYNHMPLSSIFSVSFTNHNFSSPIGLHATYCSMYVAISFITFLYFAFLSQKKGQRLFCIAACILLFAGLIQLASLAVFIGMLPVLFLFPFFVLKNGIRKLFFYAFGMFSLLFLLVSLKTVLFKDRFILKFRQDLAMNETAPTVSDPRGTRWGCALNLITQKPLTGYGSGMETALMKEKYFDKKLYNSYLHELNAHNEYLSLLLKTGIIGLCIYLFILYMGFKTAIRERDIFFSCFMILIATVSFSENILDVNKGIFFFSFFWSLFAYKKPIGFAIPRFRIPFYHRYEKISK